MRAAGADRINVGLAARDSLDGGLGADAVDGGAGNDLVIGGGGRDTLAGATAPDTPWARDGWRDNVPRGRGKDYLYADFGDVWAADCEAVNRQASAGASTAGDGLLVFSCAGCPGSETGARLFTIRPDGTRLRMLPGTEAAYAAVARRPQDRLHARVQPIELASAHGSDRRAVTRPIRQAEDTSPAWSPDGKRIAFARGRPGRRRAPGDRPGRQPPAPPDDRPVSDWSPDGRKETCGGSAGDAERGCGSWTPTALDGALSTESACGPRAALVTRREPSGLRRLRRRGLPPSRAAHGSRAHPARLRGPSRAHAWAPIPYRLALMRAVPVELRRPAWLREPRALDPDLRTSRRLIVFSMPDAGEVYGLDWRAAAQ